VDLLALLLAFGATARLAILLTRDSFPPTVKLRTRVLQRAVARVPKTRTGVQLEDPTEDPWYVLVTCPWCCSFWLALPTVTAAWAWPTAWWFLIPAAALTASLAAGVIAQLTAN
jgi:fatty acid desaturase